MAWESTADIHSALERAGRYLLGSQRADGGFGWPEVDWSDGWTTAECVLGMAASSAAEGLNPGMEWLRCNVHPDGGWSSEAYRNVTGGDSDVAATTYAMRALACCGTPADRDLVVQGREWLVSRQRPDGGWGIARADETRSHVGQTGYAISALARAPAEHRSAEAVQSALYFLYETQRIPVGWALAPGHEVDTTLTAYALRGIIDAAALRGQPPQPRIFLRWVASTEQTQNAEGAWPDWYGNPSSTESTGYCIELAVSLGLTSGYLEGNRPWVRRALSFLERTQDSGGGWGTAPGEPSSPWVTHSVAIALAALIGGAEVIAPRFRVLAEPAAAATAAAPGRIESVYDFAISFAASQRDFARALAIKLQQRGASVFFDAFETENLWGANLVDRFTQVYRAGSRLCIMIISQDYVQRAWPKLERQSAQARFLAADRDYILPILTSGHVAVPGLLETVGHLDAESYDIDEIASLAMAKLAQVR